MTTSELDLTLQWYAHIDLVELAVNKSARSNTICCNRVGRDAHNPPHHPSYNQVRNLSVVPAEALSTRYEGCMERTLAETRGDETPSF